MILTSLVVLDDNHKIIGATQGAINNGYDFPHRSNYSKTITRVCAICNDVFLSGTQWAKYCPNDRFATHKNKKKEYYNRSRQLKQKV